MKIDIQCDPEEPRKPVRPPTDFTSRAVRIRLMMLFGMLIFVLVLMREARKPQNWEWLGFGQAPANAEKPIEEKRDDTEMSPLENGGDSTDPGVLIDPEFIVSRAKEYPKQASLFWQTMYLRLNTDRQKQLFRLVRMIRQHQPLDQLKDSEREDFTKLVKFVSSKRSDFHARLFDKISLLADDAAEKKLLNDQLFEAKAIWSEKIQPALQQTLDGEDINMSQLAAISQLQLVLDQLAFSQVLDKSSLNRPVEGNAWLRIWESVLSPGKIEFEEVTHIQLTSQPDSFRGQPIRVEGWIRSAQRKNVVANELGLDHYYILWMRPQDTNLAPYCVYSQELPKGFPHVTGESIKLNEAAVIDGSFFKLRSFIDGSEQVSSCPLILANTFQWKKQTEDASVSPFAGWQPPRWFIITAFISMPIAATLIAWFVFRNTQMKRYAPGQKRQKSIEKSLVRLSDDPNIQTDLEKVQALNELDT